MSWVHGFTSELWVSTTLGVNEWMNQVEWSGVVIASVPQDSSTLLSVVGWVVMGHWLWVMGLGTLGVNEWSEME